MERSEWDDDDSGTARAPLPAHERTWRHPSELTAGQTGPTNSQAVRPLLGPGRGVAILAGSVGIVIGLGLLRLMLPAGGAELDPVDIDASEVGVLPTATGLQPTVDPATSTPRPGEGRDEILPVPAPNNLTSTPPPDVDPVEADDIVRVEPFVDAPPRNLPEAPTTVLIEGVSAVALPLSTDGFLVTTASAIAGRGATFDLVLADGSTHRAMLVATGSDLAILRLDARPDEMDGGFTPVTLAGGDIELVEGSWVTVFGATASRAVLVSTEGGLALAGLGPSNDLLEGAPVVDDAGRVVGLCSRSRGTTNLVLTHAANTVKDSAREQAWLGIAGSPASAPAPAGETPPRGVFVVEVVPDGPAARAGMMVGDDLISLDGREITSILQLAEIVAGRAPGETVEIMLVRLGFEFVVSVELGVRPYAT